MFNELKKICDLKLLGIIFLFGVLFYLAFLHDAAHNSKPGYGGIGIDAYREELFDKYGDTLEPGEWEDFNIQAKRDDVSAQADNRTESRLYALRQLENRYVNQIESYYYPDAPFKSSYDSPVVAKQMAKYFEGYSNNSMPGGIAGYFSNYAYPVGIYAILSILLVMSSYISRERTAKMYYLQYSSKTGRKTFAIQFSAVVLCSLVLSLVITAAMFAPYFSYSDVEKYFSAHIADLSDGRFTMYNVTFFEYVLLTNGLIIAFCLTAGILSFLLGRFSANFVTAMIKVVPAGIFLAVINVLAVSSSLSADNILFSAVFRGQYALPEIKICTALLLITVSLAIVTVRRERRLDV
jgi:hypothetical protein